MRVTVIQCYAPTSYADTGQKETFHESLQADVEKPGQKLHHNISWLLWAIWMIWLELGNERAMGRHGYGNFNDNSERPVEVGGMNDLHHQLSDGTLFPNKDTY